jgi:hypothetical protein
MLGLNFYRPGKSGGLSADLGCLEVIARVDEKEGG